jgi:hypothetical protein
MKTHCCLTSFLTVLLHHRSFLHCFQTTVVQRLPTMTLGWSYTVIGGLTVAKYETNKYGCTHKVFFTYAWRTRENCVTLNEKEKQESLEIVRLNVYCSLVTSSVPNSCFLEHITSEGLSDTFRKECSLANNTIHAEYCNGLLEIERKGEEN